MFFIHDIHYGSELFNRKKWESLKQEILNTPNAYILWIGDLMEQAIPNSKSDVFTQKYNPAEQKEWVTQQLKDLRKQTIAVVSGNHCSNRATKTTGLYPLYDCCLIAGVDDKYRDTIAFIDISFGRYKCSNAKMMHYRGQIQHRAKDMKNICSADYTDGIDFFAYGHDHEPKDRPRAKLIFDGHNKKIFKQNIEVINCGSFCDFGGYGAKAGYRPQSDKLYKLKLFSGHKQIRTEGFYIKEGEL